jgi:hypothetical protein
VTHNDYPTIIQNAYIIVGLIRKIWPYSHHTGGAGTHINGGQVGAIELVISTIQHLRMETGVHAGEKGKRDKKPFHRLGSFNVVKQ